MADAAALKFTLTATTGLMGAPTFRCNGVLKPGGAVEVENAEITQALPPPHGVTPITGPSGRWGNDIFNNQENLGIIITGGVASPPAQVVMRVECGFQFPEKGALKAGETLKGRGSFPNQGQPMEDVPAELKLS
ncbi:hypothetical protein [Lichenibacterium dinghuense]|uniref:hypothetical protein n=1 Tax=Lichenibacterium dinghuense TaxID=2895977 RepID=UPI001F27DD5A|nr:hypothetical protein [Lichenibacterium sp. 6Y81]